MRRDTCPKGSERYAPSRGDDGSWVLFYDYRDLDGRLFHTIAPTLREARDRREAWQAAHARYQEAVDAR